MYILMLATHSHLFTPTYTMCVSNEVHMPTPIVHQQQRTLYDMSL